MTPLDVFAKIAARNRIELSDDALRTFRDLVDVQADLVLDGFLAHLDDNQPAYESDTDPSVGAAGDLHRQRPHLDHKANDRRGPG